MCTLLKPQSSPPKSFPPNQSQKNAGAIHFMFREQLVSRIFEELQQPAIQTNIVQCFGRFSSSKSLPGNKKKRLYTSRLPTNEEIEGIFVLLAQNFKLFSNIQDKIKK
jgi:hypothetical protein